MANTDYFAELYVAGSFADAGWNVYFPHRDEGFDFIISKESAAGTEVIRPVQVKGKYPTGDKGEKTTYGYVGKLTKLHAEMVLVIPYFFTKASNAPACVAYLPRGLIRRHSRGFRCEPASFVAGRPKPRRDYARFFDSPGLSLIEAAGWAQLASVVDVDEP